MAAHELTKAKLGVVCSCGRKFPVIKAGEQHVAEETEREANEAKHAEPTVTSEEAKDIDDDGRSRHRADGKPIPEVPNTTPVTPQPEQPKPEPSKELQKTQQAVATPLAQTANMVRAYARNLVDDKRAQQFFAQVSLMARNNPRLANVKMDSLLAAVMACVHLDLMPNTPEGYAYVIPYGDQAQFQLGYKGMAELAYRTGSIRSINAELVFPGDIFEVELGTTRRLVHKPSFDTDRTDYKASTHVYATAELSNGVVIFEVLTHREVGKVQASAKAKSTDSPWQTWPEAMAKKTAVKRLLKLIPSSAEDNRLKTAAEWDSLNEAGKRLVVDAETGEVIEADKNTLPDEIEQAINGAESREDLNKVLQSLNVADRKKATSLVQQRMRELA